MHSVEISLQNQLFIHWNTYTTNAQDLLLHVLAISGCPSQGSAQCMTAVRSTDRFS